MPRVADEFVASVVFLYPTREAALEGSREGGTGFVTYMPSGSGKLVRYLVTNEHIANRGHRFVRVPRLPQRDAETLFDVVAVPVESWRTSPPHDLAVAPLALPLDQEWRVGGVAWDEYAVTKDDLIADSIGPGDDVALIGRLRGFEGAASQRTFVRFGAISVLPEEPLRDGRGKDVPVYVVDVTSQQGFSGSPVVLNINLMHPRQLGRGSVSPGLITGFLGVAAGYLWTTDEQRAGATATENSGLTLVVPAWIVTALFNRPDLTEERELLADLAEHVP